MAKFRYLSDAEYQTVMERAGEYEGRIDPEGRSALMIILGLHGLRCGEVCGLIVDDIDLGGRTINVDTLKKGRPRTIDLEPRILHWLCKFAEGKPEDALIFTTRTGGPVDTRHVRRSMDRLSKRWIGRHVRYHCTRHTAAQRLYAGTHDPLKVQKFLGHRSMTATLIYAEATGDLRDHMPKLPDFKLRLAEVG